MPVHYMNILARNILCRWVRGLEPPTEAIMSTRVHSDVTCVRCIDAMNEVF